MECQEVTLSTIQGSDENHRLAVVLVTGVPGTALPASRVELRQQTWGEGVGWFTQTSIALEPEQVAGLKATLGSTSCGGAKSTGKAAATLPASFRTARPIAHPPHLKIARADSA